VTLVYNAVYRLSIVPFFLQISALKFESCSISRRILDVFCLSKFSGGGACQMLYISDNVHFMARHVANINILLTSCMLHIMMRFDNCYRSHDGAVLLNCLNSVSSLPENIPTRDEFLMKQFSCQCCFVIGLVF